MRAPISWLTRGDAIILEFLNGHEAATFEQSPALIARNAGLSSGHVRRRVRVLAAANLVTRTDDRAGYYAITDLGERYLRGELTSAEIRTLRGFNPDR